MKKENKSALRRLVVTFAILLIVRGIALIFRVEPKIYYIVYDQFVYPVIRFIYDHLVGIWLPIPMWWLSIPFILYLAVFRHSFKYGMFHYFLRVMGSVLIIFSCFYIFWGWHYSQPTIEKRVGWQSLEVDTLALYNEAEIVVKEIQELRSIIQEDTSALIYEAGNRKDLEKEMRKEVTRVLTNLSFQHPGKPRIRVHQPRGLLLRMKTAGIYFPYSFEGHIDAGLVEIEWPFTMAHEMAHAYGVANEGECNFIAYLACKESKNPYFQYSALLDYSLYVLRDVYRVNPKKYSEYLSLLPKGYRNDIQRIRENNAKYPDILPKFRDFMYDQYLKGHGVEGGLQSYSQIVRLVMQYKLEEKN